MPVSRSVPLPAIALRVSGRNTMMVMITSEDRMVRKMKMDLINSQHG